MQLECLGVGEIRFRFQLFYNYQYTFALLTSIIFPLFFFTFRVIKKRIYIEFCVIDLNFSFELFRCEITMQNQTAVTDPELDQDVDKICLYVTTHPNSFFSVFALHFLFLVKFSTHIRSKKSYALICTHLFILACMCDL